MDVINTIGPVSSRETVPSKQKQTDKYFYFLAGGGKEDEGVKYVSLDLSSIEAPLADLPGLRILEVTEVQDLSSGVRVPDLERFMSVLHPSASGAEAGYGPSGMEVWSTPTIMALGLEVPSFVIYIHSCNNTL